MAIVLVHGAGSTGDAAAALLGPILAGTEVVRVEDRTGDVDVVAQALAGTVASLRECRHVIGVSLGAHAVAHWASRASAGGPRGAAIPQLCFVLPAWLGAPDSTAGATAQSADDVARSGIAATLARLRREFPSMDDHEDIDIVGLVDLAWSQYDDSTLAATLRQASTTPGPTVQQLARITSPTSVVGWEGDLLHPASVSRRWSAALPRCRVGLASRPSVRRLRMAAATVAGLHLD